MTTQDAVRVVRGRAATLRADRELTGRLLELAADGEPGVRVWTPHRQVAFGRRDAGRASYERAREIARERGFSSVERRVGGRAVAYDGETTLAFARAEPIADSRRGLQDRYERIEADLAAALRSLGLRVEPGEPDDAFCPGCHSLRLAGGGKLVGIAQRVRREAALVAGVCVVANGDALAEVYEEVYGTLDVPFDPASVGSVANGDRVPGDVIPEDGPGTVESVRLALEDGLVGDRRRDVRRVTP